MNKKFLLLVVSLILIVPAVHGNIYPLLVSPYLNGSLQPNTNVSYELNFTDTPSCTGVLLSDKRTVLTNSYGVALIELNITSLRQKPNYLCQYVNGTLRKLHSIPDVIGQRLLVEEVQVSRLLNVTGELYFNNSLVCTSANGLCAVAANGSGSVTSVVAGSGLNRTNITTAGTLVANYSEVQARISLNCPGGIQNITEGGLGNCQEQFLLQQGDDWVYLHPSRPALFRAVIDAWNLTNISFLENKTTCYAGNVSGVLSQANIPNQSNTHLHACQNITGASSNLCTIVDTDTNTHPTTFPAQNLTNVSQGLANSTLVHLRNITNGLLVNNCTSGQLVLGFHSNGSLNCATDQQGSGGNPGVIVNASTTTCSGTDKISAYNNATGAFTCSADQTGSGSSATAVNMTRWNQTTTSSTLFATIQNLSITIEAQQNYSFDCEILFGVNGTTVGITLGLNATSTYNQLSYSIETPTSGTAWLQRAFINVDEVAHVGTSVGASHTPYAAWIRGSIYANGNAQRLEPLWRAEVGATTNVVVIMGSKCVTVKK